MITAAALSLTGCLFSTIASAEQYEQNIVAIFGSGNPDTGWTVDSDNGLTLALRAKNRENGSTANNLGVYYEPVGYQAPQNNRARWNWEFSINSGTENLDAYDFYIAVDTDPTVGVSQYIADALLTFADNSYGNDQTANGLGVEGTAATYAGMYNISQQSQNLVFWGQDPTIDGTYDYELYAVAKGDGYNGQKLASTSITVVVGDGGDTVEDLLAELAANATNHGDYVADVNDLTKYLIAGGAIDKKQRQMILTTAAKSSVGK